MVLKTLYELHNEIEKQRKSDRKFLKPIQWAKKEIEKLEEKAKDIIPPQGMPEKKEPKKKK